MPNWWYGFMGQSDSQGHKGLGYRYVRDPRSDTYTMAPRLKAAPEPPPERRWQLRGNVLDQGREGSCVGHGWAHWISCDDVNGQTPKVVDHAYALDIYNWAQNNDEWADTPPEEGTSVLAGAKACVNFRHLKEGYVWGRTIQDLVTWVGNFGPVVMGSLWLSGMVPDANGYVPIVGKIAGGHCYLCVGYMWVTSLNPARLVLIFVNSWGEDWADGGFFYVFADDYQTLIDRGNYSMCSALELAPEIPHVPPEPEPEHIKVNLQQLVFSPNRYYGKPLEIVDRRRSRWKADPV